MPRTVNRRPLACVVQNDATGRFGGHTRHEARRGRRAGLRRGRPAQSAAGRDGDFVDLRRGATRALRTPYVPAGSRCTTCAPSASTGSSTIRSKAPSADALALARPVCGLRRENERRRRRRCPAGGCFREDSGRTNRRQRTLSPAGQALYTTLWDSNRDPLSAAVTAAHPAHPRDATRTPVVPASPARPPLGAPIAGRAPPLTRMRVAPLFVRKIQSCDRSLASGGGGAITAHRHGTGGLVVEAFRARTVGPGSPW
jgi:hypothetical protein